MWYPRQMQPFYGRPFIGSRNERRALSCRNVVFATVIHALAPMSFFCVDLIQRSMVAEDFNADTIHQQLEAAWIR